MNDIVNKVDYLSRNGVVPLINSMPDDPMVKKYYVQLERTKKVYANIDNYYSSH